MTVLAGGTAMVASEINDQSEKDLVTAEAIALPLSLIVLVWVFGGLFAALLPLVVGGLAIVGTLGMLRAITLFTDVSIFSLDLTTAMGLALAIDYTLLLVSRYREEHAQTGDRDEALRRAVATAGRTILFSACTVFLAVSALAVFPMYFLRSMAYAGCGVVALAGLYAVVVAPAVIKLLGDRIESLNIRTLFGRSNPRPGRQTQLPVHVDQLRHAARPAVRPGGGGAAARARGAVRARTLRPARTTACCRPPPSRDRWATPCARVPRRPGDGRVDRDSRRATPRPTDDVAGYAAALSKVPGVEAVATPTAPTSRAASPGRRCRRPAPRTAACGCR